VRNLTLFAGVPLIIGWLSAGCSRQAEMPAATPSLPRVVEQPPPANLPSAERAVLDEERRRREQAIAERKRDGR
jgi:hypothetical protein